MSMHLHCHRLFAKIITLQVIRREIGNSLFAMLRDRMVVIGYPPRGADRHVFSMRKANDREQALIAPLLGI